VTPHCSHSKAVYLVAYIERKRRLMMVAALANSPHLDAFEVVAQALHAQLDLPHGATAAIEGTTAGQPALLHGF